MKKYLLLTICLASVACAVAQTISTVAGGNGQGNNSNQFNSPQGIYVDGYGNVYVADQGNDRIMRFPAGSGPNTVGEVIAGGNGPGAAHDQLDLPGAVCVDDSGYIYVSDSYNNRVMRFPPGSNGGTAGKIVAGGNGQGDSANQFWHTGGIFVDHIGDLYVADQSNYRIQKFPPGSDSLTPGVTVAGGNGMGTAANQFSSPQYIYVDDSGYLYASDFVNARILRFAPGSSPATAGVILVPGGSGPDSLGRPTGLCMDSLGSIYVADWADGRVLRFTAAGQDAVTAAGGYGAGTGMYQLSAPEGIYVDRSGAIYIADSENNRVQKWTQYGNGISGTLQVTDVQCYGDSDGALAISASGATAPYQYTLNGGSPQSTGSFGGLGPMPFVLLVTDSLGDTRVYVDTITGPAAPLAVSDSISLSAGDSSITLLVSGGTGPYHYHWSDSTTGPQLISPGDGRYIVTVTDSRGCTVVDTISLTGLGIAGITAGHILSVYPDPGMGYFTLQTEGAIGSVYTITDMLGRVIARQNITSDRQGLDIKDISAGTYMLLVKDQMKQLLIEK